MAQSTRTRRFGLAGKICTAGHVAVIVALSFCFAGCSWPVKPDTKLPTKTETETAVSQIKDDMLLKCEGLGPERDNTVGNLAQDFADAAAGLATCITRHNELVDYLKPIVAKEKAK